MTAASRRLRFCAQALLVAVLVFAPAALGSNTFLALAVNAAAVAALLCCTLAAEQDEATDLRMWRRLAPVLAAALLLIAWMIVQAVVPAGALRHPDWNLLADGGARTISVAPAATLTAAAKFATLAAAAFAAALLAGRGAGARPVLFALLGATGAMALYGLVLEALGSDTILWLPKWAYHGYLTGTFVNRNHAASFLGLGLCAAVALAVSGPPPGGASSLRRRTLLVILAALLILALARTGSRAGSAAALGGAASTVLLHVLCRRGARRMTLRRLGFAAAAAIALFAAAGGSLLARFAALGGNLADRLSVYRSTLRAIADRPLVGHGAGSFADIFPAYREAALWPERTWTTAHNIYLGIAADLGIPALLLGLCMAAAIVWPMLRALVRRTEPMPGVLAALGATVLVAAHALLDFSLELQGFALPFAILVGAGLGEALRDTSRGMRAETIPKRTAFAMAGALSVILVVGAARFTILAWGTPPALWIAGDWPLVDRVAAFSPAEAARAERASRYVESVTFFPPRYGDCARWPASSRIADGCLALLDAALAEAPAAGELWLEKARLSLLSGQGDAARIALEHAYALAPHEGWLAVRRARFVLSSQMALTAPLAAALRRDVETILASWPFTVGLARASVDDATLGGNLAPILEQSRNAEGVRRFRSVVLSLRPAG